MTLGPNGEVIDDGERGDQVSDTEGTDRTDPTDLNEAFKMYREANKEETSPNVPGASGTGYGVDDDEGSDESYDLGAGGSDSTGGSSASVSEASGQAIEPEDLSEPDDDIDYGSYAKELVNEINKSAIAKVDKKFEELGIREVTISQLYEKDERTGRVSFKNPDDPGRSFSSRSEAQAWVNSYNQDVKSEMKRAAIAERDAMLEQYKPTMELISFAPKLNKMSEDERLVMNQIVEPYAIKDSSGQITGYRCDLNEASKRAKSMVSSMKSRWNVSKSEPAKQAKKQAGTTPAVDMKSHGGAGTDSDAEPKNIQEAMAIYNKQKAAKRNSKKKGK